VRRWIPFLLFAAFVVGLSALFYWEPFQRRVPAFVNSIDKVIHFALAGGLAFTFDRALARKSWRRIPVAPLLLLVAMAIEEYMQQFAKTRTASIWDYTADVAGVTFFTWLSRRRSEPGLANAGDDVAK